jgi:hypothetical protein
MTYPSQAADNKGHWTCVFGNWHPVCRGIEEPLCPPLPLGAPMAASLSLPPCLGARRTSNAGSSGQCWIRGVDLASTGVMSCNQVHSVFFFEVIKCIVLVVQVFEEKSPNGTLYFDLSINNEIS